MNIPLLELSGGPRERGLAHGEALRAQVRSAYELYRAVIGLPEDALAEAGAGFGALVRAHTPELSVEMDAIAEGAGLEAWQIQVLNARSELMARMPDGCTAVLVPRARVLAQTWDFLEALEELFVILRIEREDGHRLVTLTEPGMVGKIGLSSAGIGVCLNFLGCPGPLRGLPVHVLLRAVMDAPDLAAARAVVESAAPGQSGNLLIGTAAGEGLEIELAGEARSFHPIADDPFAHTNHHLWHDIDAGAIGPGSRTRLATANARIEAGLEKLEDVRELLSDQSDERFPVCRAYLPFLPGAKLGTICTVLMELDAGRVHLRRGPDPDADFHVLEV